MPTYSFACEKCDQTLDYIGLKMGERPDECDGCGAPGSNLERSLSDEGFFAKTSGANVQSKKINPIGITIPLFPGLNIINFKKD